MREALQLATRAGASAGISLAIANALGLAHPVFAMIAAVIVTDLAAAKTRELAWPRLVGTLIGAVMGAVASYWLPTSAWSAAFGIAVVMLACTALRMPQAAKLAGYVAGIILFSQASQPWLYALERLVETGLGVSVAIAVSMVPKLLAAQPAPRTDP